RNRVRGTSQNQPAPGAVATANVAVSSQADVAVALSETPSPVDAGTNITYTLTVTNNGPSDAQTVSFSDAVPAGLTFVSEMQNSGPTFTVVNPPGGGTGATTGTIATLLAGASAVFTIVDHLPSSFPN